MAKRSETKPSSRHSFEVEAAATARHQREIQSKIDRSGEPETEAKEPAHVATCDSASMGRSRLARSDG